jgi:sugar phosphate isomerase/epimerase
VERILNRRSFVRRAVATGAVLALSPLRGAATAGAGARVWPHGCFNRPWYKWSFDDALDAIESAGYKGLGLLGGHPGDPLIGPGATPEYLATLKSRIAARGLTAIVGAFRVNHKEPLATAIDYARARIESAHALGLAYLLTADEPKPEFYAQNIKVMAAAAGLAQERGIKLVFKPHGSDAATLLRLLQDVGHPNFKIWYDAGNIIYYTGKDPLADLDPLLEHTTGFCAKDCTGAKGEAMIQFGNGKVDFPGLFARFKQAGFSGPIMTECCVVGANPDATAKNAAANRVFLERLLAPV